MTRHAGMMSRVLATMALILAACASPRASRDDPAPPASASVNDLTSTVPTDGATGLTDNVGRPTTAAAAGSSSSSTAAPTATGAEVEIPPSGLYDSNRPPQFVLFSFDGAADPALMKRWRDAASASAAHLTFFLSAVYLLSKAARTRYQGPGHAPGASAIGFSPTPTGDTDNVYIADVVRSLQQARRDGHEIGNHYGGHWCGAAGVGTWSKADWAAELDQVESVVLKVDQNNGIVPGVGAPYDPIAVAGSRTPCLEGKLDQLYPVLKARGYRYDASNTKGLFDWPRQRSGLWAFGFAGITIAGLPRPTISVDYSISTGFNGDAVRGVLSSEQESQIYQAVRDGYLSAFDSLYYGNRAPFEVGNHFNHSDGDTYNRAVADVMKTVCARPEVVCTTYSRVADWLDAHAGQIGELERGRFTKLSRGA